MINKHKWFWNLLIIGYFLCAGMSARAQEDAAFDFITEESEQIIWETEQIEWETEQIEWETEQITWETERDPRVWISNVRFLSGEGYKIYDGTCDVNLMFDVTNLPENLEITLRGRTEKSDVGRYPVIIEAYLSGEGAEAYDLVMDQEYLELEIVPRPLFVTISNARKPYFQDVSLENLFFESMEIVQVEGFVTDPEGSYIVPESFALPKVRIDGSMITKESPMYQIGREWVYTDAITLSEDKDTVICGNYCYRPNDPDYTRKGAIILTQPFIEEGKDYQILGNGTVYIGEDGNRWVAPGTSLEIIPQTGSGFTEGFTLGPLYESGTGEFSLSAVDMEGYLSAVSQIRSLTWNVDAQAPEGMILASEGGNDENIVYTDKDIQIQAVGEDVGSGIKSTVVYLAREEQCLYEPETVYALHPDLWQEMREVTLTEEGRYCVFARFTDQVGNVSYQKSSIFVIDRKAPLLSIENLLDGSANQGTVLPVLIAQDENLEEKALQFRLTGSKNGERKVVFQRQVSTMQEKISIPDFPREKDWDDVYYIEVTAKDLAGNTASKKIRFSVNRFGSTYYIEESEKLLQEYYLRKPVDIVVGEMNVDDLVETSIMIGYEDTVRFLKKDVDYEMDLVGDQDSFKEYRYRIPASEFQKDGHYYIVFSSKDKANNLGDNRLERKNVEFAVDSRPPILVVTGIEDGKIYNSAREVTLECIENMELDYVHFLVDGEEKGDGKSASQKIHLGEKEGWQQIKVTAKDKAGNESTCFEAKIMIGEKEKTRKEADTETEKVLKENAKTVKKEQNSNLQEHREESSWKWKILGFIVFFGILKGILWFIKGVKR